jgi:hypothetical protein
MDVMGFSLSVLCSGRPMDMAKPPLFLSSRSNRFLRFKERVSFKFEKIIAVQRSLKSKVHSYPPLNSCSCTEHSLNKGYSRGDSQKLAQNVFLYTATM